MKDHELAQLNIAKLIEPLDSERLSGFVANLDRINALAESSPGFVWRPQEAEGDATTTSPFGDEHIVNLSVWDSSDSLRHFVYQSDHLEIMRRSNEWFTPMKEASMVLWWVPVGHRPSLTEASEKLEHLQKNGSSLEAFTFKEVMDA